jgi:hypothetical protein
MKISEDRVGLKKKNSFGLTMEVIEYKNSNNILVKFEQGEILYVLNGANFTKVH